MPLTWKLNQIHAHVLCVTIKQSLHKVFRSLTSLWGEKNHPSLCPIGCSEMLMAKVVADLASRTPGKEAVAMESFGKALRMVSSHHNEIYWIITGHSNAQGFVKRYF